DRALVMDENHRVAVQGKPAEILADTDFLLKINLIHEHSHRHRGQVHAHAHLEVKHHKEEG
ncbi:MAG: ABC transporter, partial [Dehalococcoidia bacterium]|nr:ABC transporter [Dehalococcoidia bacterium]